MLSIRVAALAACAAALSPTPTATPRQRLGTRRSFGGFKFENPFDDRPGATVGKLQIALVNEDMSATRVVADCAARFERDRSRAALPKVIADVATPSRGGRAPGSTPPPLESASTRIASSATTTRPRTRTS